MEMEKARGLVIRQDDWGGVDFPPVPLEGSACIPLRLQRAQSFTLPVTEISNGYNDLVSLDTAIVS